MISNNSNNINNNSNHNNNNKGWLQGWRDDKTGLWTIPKANTRSWWLKDLGMADIGSLNKEIVWFLMAAQEHALTTDAIKVKIDKQEGDVTCRMGKNREETITRLTSECIK